jgi:tetratricopeptide (TPR) repeat protein
VFAREASSDAALMKALEQVVLFQVDCEKGEGVEIAKQFGVKGYPTFAIVNSAGETTDRFIGYGGPEGFIEVMNTGLDDTRTIAQKKAAYDKAPTLALTLALARNAGSSYQPKEAVDYYMQARKLDSENASDYTGNIVRYISYGMRSDDFTFDDLETEVAATMKAKWADAGDKVSAALTLQEIAKKQNMAERGIPYMKKALKASKRSKDEEVKKRRVYLEIEYALLVDKDGDKAIRLRRSTMPEGWQDDAGRLNSFAWWCFENNLNLEEAEELALRGVEIAETDGERANILDTAAELCNALGNCEEAIERIKQAIALDPEKKYFKDQLVRFEKVLVEKQSG